MNDADVHILRQQMELLTKDLDALAFCVSHDLRAPLRAISRFTHEVVSDTENKLTDRSKGDLERVLAASERMDGLIEDLIVLSRVSRRPMVFSEVSLSEAAERIAHGLKAAAPARKVEFVIQSGLRIVGDAYLLEILLQQLIGNAWKFSSKHAHARIEFGKIQKDGREMFFVRDNGAGFDMKYVHKLFAPFQRLHTDEEFPGVGIGLALAHRILARHGGSALLEGQEGDGATFYFFLPAVPVTTSA